MAQTIREWFNDSDIGINAISVCSDQKISKANLKNDTVDISASNIPINVTTEPDKLYDWASKIKTDKMNVVFSTYQSIQTISDMQKNYDFCKFDIIICDEAHRTTGVTFEDKTESNFVKVHDEKYIKAHKRLYMTATPKIYTDNVKIKAKKVNSTLTDMSDEKIFGKDIHHISFNYAVEKDLLTDYKVIVLALSENAVDAEFQELLTDDNKQLDIEYTTKLVGCYKALCKNDLQYDKITDKNPMQKSVAFTKDIQLSKDITKIFPKIARAYKDKVEDKSDAPLDIEMRHIDGSFDADSRKKLLNWLQEEKEENICRILSNARCLSEGVDVPTLDSVMFMHPRKSMVDVIQAVGRVMRKAPNKKMGYIILPVAVPAGTDPNASLDKNKQYKVVWQVLNALRSHDERLEGKINRMDFGGNVNDTIEIICQSNIFPSSKNKSTKTDSNDKIDKKHKNQSDDLKNENDNTLKQKSFEWEESILNAIKATIVENCGTRSYWEDWAEDITEIAKKHISRIENILRTDESAKLIFIDFVKELQDDLNPKISDKDVVELLAQHLITKPVFDSLFEGYEFTKKNPVSRAIDNVLSVIENNSLNEETKKLDKFYQSVKNRIADTKTVTERQNLIIRLYDKFFKKAFPKTTEQLGIVYTPVEIVDFIIHSINDVLQDEFNTEIGANGINIIDPFTGTGTFITRLLQSGLIKPDQLEYKYKNEIHANEIVLLAYYIAGINVEQVFTEIMTKNGKQIDCSPFDGICLTDTFQMYEGEDLIDKLMPDNSERRKKQKALDIRVIMGNPPYSAGQKSANDNAQNVAYPNLDSKIKETYVANSNSTNNNSLYDSYIRAIKWGTERLGDNGVIGYITNGGFIDSNSMSGLRKCLADEYTSLYIFNLRGNIRKNMTDKQSGEGENVFEVKVPVAITIFVKNKNSNNVGNIYYHDIGDNLKKQEKLNIIKNFKSINGIKNQENKNTDNGQIGFEKIIPNKYNDWIKQRDKTFHNHIKMGDKKTKGKGDTKAIFLNYSGGLKTNRDSWVYNSSKTKLIQNVKNTIDFYNSELERYQQSDKSTNVKDFINYDSTKISWAENYKNILKSKKSIFKDISIQESNYRPFTKQYIYYNKEWNERTYQLPNIFPIGADLPNKVICTSGLGGSGFSVIITDKLPDLNSLEAGAQCFPLKLYQENKGDDLLTQGAGDYIVQDGITDYAQKHFSYDELSTEPQNKFIPNKQEIFYYIYGILNHPDYVKKWGDTLIKELPRIPKVKTVEGFKQFSRLGEKLADLHINYEDAELYPVNFAEGEHTLSGFTDKHYRVEKMKFKEKNKNKDMTTIIYNEHITITGIPIEAYNYIVNGKSPVEWVMNKQVVTTNKESGITNDANDFAIEVMNNPKYPLELLQKVITVSLETQKLKSQLPKLEF